jgi:hypothetical protein
MKGSSVKTLHDWIEELYQIRNYSHDHPHVAEIQERIISKKMKMLFSPEELREYGVFFKDDF